MAVRRFATRRLASGLVSVTSLSSFGLLLARARPVELLHLLPLYFLLPHVDLDLGARLLATATATYQSERPEGQAQEVYAWEEVTRVPHLISPIILMCIQEIITQASFTEFW